MAALVGLPLSPGGGEITLLALPATAHTWRVAGVVDTSQVAFDLATPAWDAGLVDTFVLLWLVQERVRFGLEGDGRLQWCSLELRG